MENNIFNSKLASNSVNVFPISIDRQIDENTIHNRDRMLSEKNISFLVSNTYDKLVLRSELVPDSVISTMSDANGAVFYLNGFVQSVTKIDDYFEVVFIIAGYICTIKLSTKYLETITPNNNFIVATTAVVTKNESFSLMDADDAEESNEQYYFSGIRIADCTSLTAGAPLPVCNKWINIHSTQSGADLEAAKAMISHYYLPLGRVVDGELIPLSLSRCLTDGGEV